MSAIRSSAALAGAAMTLIWAAGGRVAAAAPDAGAPLTAERVRSVLIEVFHRAPYETTIGGGGESTLLSAHPTKLRRYVVVATVARLPAITDFTWRRRRAWRESGFAMARFRNVIVTASSPNAQIGVTAPVFPMPRLVWEFLRRLASRSA
jgi:hypothetical protein